MLDSYRELLDLLAATPTKLKAAADAAGDPPAGEWGAAQVLAHMATAEKMWLQLLDAIMNQPNAPLPRPNADLAAYQERLMIGTIAENIAEFNTLRGEMVSLLMGLSLRDWERSAIHETRGELAIADLVEMIVDHDSEHLGQLETLA